jgi:hypothetical protein
VCRFVLAAIFLMAAVTKVMDLDRFARLVVDESGLREEVAVWVAAWLPWLELTAAGCLVFGYAVREAALLLAVLLVIFLGYSLVHLLLPGSSPVPLDQTDCGCFFFPRVLPETFGWWLPVRNLMLLGCAVCVAGLGQPP